MKKKVLITGAAGGIGKACVMCMAKMEDIDIIAVSRSDSALKELKQLCLSTYNKDIDILAVDFRDVMSFKLIDEFVESKHGELNYLINNAGILYNIKFMNVTEAEFHDQVHVNLYTPVRMTQIMIKYLEKSADKSHVVNIGSMGGFMGSDKFPGLSIYSATKGALAILSECLAVEYLESSINFNCLALGSADTEMLKKAFPDYTSPTSAEEMAEYIVEFTLNGHRHFNGKVIPVAGVST